MTKPPTEIQIAHHFEQMDAVRAEFLKEWKPVEFHMRGSNYSQRVIADHQMFLWRLHLRRPEYANVVNYFKERQ